jgi:hypothetical protein
MRAKSNAMAIGNTNGRMIYGLDAAAFALT